jgi:two-component system, chemotaxis family, protein-glutamate methylesterase/glutaminase
MHDLMTQANRDIVVIGASAGGLQAILELLAPLPAGLPASIFVVVHTAPEGTGLFPEILERSGAWNVDYAQDLEEIQHGRVYVATPDRHLLVKRGHVRVTLGPRENRFRPAVDPLFRTAARAYGPRVIGIVLSGGLNDGTHGLELIKRHGGMAIAQDPQNALMQSMPLSAIQNVEVDYILAPGAIGAKLPFLVAEDVEDSSAMVSEGTDVAEGVPDNLRTGHIPGPPSAFTCPECGGSLWELEDGKLLRFRCHVGHGFTADALSTQQDEELEHTMWTALRALEEHAALRRRMAAHAERVGRFVTARELEARAKDAERRAGSLRGMLLREERGEPRLVDKPAAAAAEAKRNGRTRQRTGS